MNVFHVLLRNITSSGASTVENETSKLATPGGLEVDGKLISRDVGIVQFKFFKSEQQTKRASRVSWLSSAITPQTYTPKLRVSELVDKHPATYLFMLAFACLFSPDLIVPLLH